MRASGILMPVSSLPSPYGIGDFSNRAYEFVNMLKAAGQSCWQILPLGPTSYGDSPYQSFSTYAGNPYFISIEALIDEGLLAKNECDACDLGEDKKHIDYGKIYRNRIPLLKLAYKRSRIGENRDFLEFCAEEAWWLDDYALFMAVKDLFDGTAWYEWPEDIRMRKPAAVNEYNEKLKRETECCKYVQYLFFKQWKKLKKYANDNGISIIGDIPIYVAFDSADVWAGTRLFQLDSNNMPTAVAGCPPDGFSATGQLWGNPLYDWEYHKETEYDWWIRRIKACMRMYDIVRIDHFRGFDEYYSIPYGEPTAERGCWKAGPGIDLFNKIKEKLGRVNIIAEDLGFITDSVKKLVEDSGYPGMKVLEFAFDSREEGNYLPHTYDRNCVVYTGTHDNETIAGWYDNLKADDKEMALEYMGCIYTPEKEIYWEFIRLAMMSVADLCIIPIQDYLGLGNDARMNKPSTIGCNWKWRLMENEISDELVKRIYELTKISFRC